ncbi:MAG: glycosyltransferase family 4 protein [Deltaproteobacteria bacterium]|nr:glycosyltransferase family 4 protein [Deltaproteobacteria bacterium]
MRVLHVNEHLELKGGVETYLLSLRPLLEAKGIQNHLVFGSGDPSLWPGAIEDRAIGSIRFRAEPKDRARLIERFRTAAPDVIHLHNVQSLSAFDAALAVAPTVLTTHDFRWICPANTFYFKRTREVCQRKGVGPMCFVETATKKCLTPRPRAAAFFVRRAKHVIAESPKLKGVIAPSSAARDRLVAAGFPSSILEVAPYFCPVTPRETARPIPEKATITFLGRAAPNKGFESFVEALGRLPRVEGIMAGSFSEGAQTEVRAIAERAGCAGRLSVEPWASRARVLEIIDRTSVLVFPSLWPETLGIVGLEALARGVPVVASDVGGVREWLRDGVNGVLVPPKDAAAIARGVTWLLRDPEELLRVGREGLRTIREAFSPALHVERLTRVYERAAGRTATPRRAPRRLPVL